MATATVYTKTGFSDSQRNDVNLFSPIKFNGGKEHHTLDPVLHVMGHPMHDLANVHVADTHDYLILDYGRVMSRKTMLWLAKRILVDHVDDITLQQLQMQLLEESTTDSQYDANLRSRVDSDPAKVLDIWHQTKVMVRGLKRMALHLTVNQTEDGSENELSSIRMTSTLFMARYSNVKVGQHQGVIIGSDLETV